MTYPAKAIELPLRLDLPASPQRSTVFDRKEHAKMGKKNEDDWDPQAGQDQVTDPDTRVSQNGDVHSSLADDEDREGK
ncbi:hypothetical protein ADK38_15435 [Streptomyces varsoviensis]|uniref:Uncharacterized protein n=2 Tax=Streptomyces varsoviensis TaxID=67373 RepID=A0ABR5J743_9ACTN|nr:hypothetical protein ADK38_15435 [Streptomyces varsoviensis]